MDIVTAIDKFDGTGNFDVWKNDVRDALGAKDLLYIVDHECRVNNSRGEPTFSAEDQMANSKALIIIRSSLSNEYKHYYLGITASELWFELNTLFGSAKTGKIVVQLVKLLACKMQPGDKQGRLFTAKFKSIMQAMQSSGLTYDQLITLIYVSSLNDEFRSVSTHFGAMRPSSFTLDKVAKMVCEHSDTFQSAVDQDSKPFAGTAHNSGNTVCQYCSKHGHTADKCHAISRLKGEQNPDETGGSANSNSGNGNSSSNSKKPQAKSKKNTFSVKIAGTSILAASAASSLLGKSDAWLLDSGANASSCNSHELFTELQGYSGEIMTMSGDSVAIKGRGTASIGKGCNDIGIDNVLYTPDAAISLLSVHRLAEGGLDEQTSLYTTLALAMIVFTVDKIRGLMDKTANIRNVSVVTSSDDGQLALTGFLAAKGGITPPASSDSTAKSVANSMYFELDEGQMEDIVEKEEGNGFLISLVNSSSHDYTSSDVAAALRVTDGLLVVADATISGVSAQVETALRIAHAELVKPVLLIDGVDCALLEHKLSREDLYQSFRRVIENVNVAISTYQDTNAMGSQLVGPELGTVAFGSSTQGWCLTLRQLATRYAKELGIERSKLMAKLWGDNFYDSRTKMWSTQSSSATSKNTDCGFNLLVLDPIYKLFGASLEGDADKALALADNLGITLTAKERTLADKALLTAVMGKYLPAADALVEMFCICLPSPAKAQSYRCGGLYEGPQDDKSAAGIRACDPSGPLILYVSKLVPASDKGRFYAFGRVFSGTVKTGQRVRIQGPNCTPGKHIDLFVTTTQSTVIMMGSSIEPIDDCPAGNIVGLVGVDQYLLNSGTITISETAHNMKAIRFSVSPVVNITVAVINLKDLPKLVEGLKRLSKASPSVKCSTSDTGVHTIAGASELHLTKSLKDLEEDYAQIPITKGAIFAEYRETVQAKSSAIMMARSPNRHSRFYLTAEPIQEELAVLIDNGKIAASDDINERAHRLVNKFEWDASDARKIWAFGPEPSGANLLVGMAKGVQYLSEIKDSCVLGFNYSVAEGPCVGAPMRGCRFNILDVTLQTDAIHRGAGQILPTMRRAIYGATLLANPSLQEPIYIVDVQCPRDIVSSVHSLIHDLLGHIIEESQQPGSLLCSVKAYLPVAKSLGFSKLLHKETDGMASLRTMTFAHWKTVEGLANEPGEALNMCLSIRKRKSMPENIPAHDYYIDKS